MTTTEDNEARDQGAVEALARAVDELWPATGEGDPTFHRRYANAFLDALAVEGYSVIRAEWEYGVHWDGDMPLTVDEDGFGTFESADAAARRAMNGSDDTFTILRRRISAPGPWEPVPESSTLGGSAQ